MRKKFQFLSLVLIIIVVIILIGAFFLTGGRTKTTTDTNKALSFRELVIYSGRKDALILPIIDSFEKKTGTKVTLKSGKTEELANLLLQEKENTQADIYIGTDASLLEKLSKNGLLTQITTSELSNIPAAYRAEDNTWTGVSGRARVLMVNTNMLPANQWPSSIYDVINQKWNGKVAMANLTNESVVTHISALRALHGDEFARNFLRDLKKNNVTPLSGGHTDVRQAVGRGEFSVGFVNHYYAHLQMQETPHIAIIYPDQGAGHDGAFVNVSGVGVIRFGKNQSVAQEFVAYLLSEEAQQQFAELNFEFPLRAGIKSTNTKNLGEFKEMDVDLHSISKMLDSSIEIIKQEGF